MDMLERSALMECAIPLDARGVQFVSTASLRFLWLLTYVHSTQCGLIN